jgi:arylsulfatase A-like enzyme
MNAGLAINGPLRGGKHTEWEGGFREPFLVRWPGKVSAGSVSEQMICLTDMLATFAAIFEVSLPKGSAEDSFDVLRTFTETEPGPAVRDHVLLQAANATYDIRMGDWKLVERQDAPEFESIRNPKKSAQAARQRAASANKKDELFNLRDDPSEKTNVRSTNRARANRMKRALNEARDRGFTRPGAG